ncbi:MAG: tetratricopeptide repeat protein [Fuerstiella sp.]
MPESIPPDSNQNSAQPNPGFGSGRRRRLARRCAIGLALTAAVLYWQREKVVGIPVQAAVSRQIANRELDDALWWVRLGQTLQPQDPRFLLLRAKIARHQGQMQAVAEALKQAAELGASRSELNRAQWLALAQSGQMRQAEPHLPELLTDRNHDNKEVCEAFVIGFIRSHRTDSALQLLDPWIADAPDDATPRLLRARIHQLLSSPRDAEQDFLAAISIDPDWLDPQLELAELLVERKRFADARGYFQKLLDRNFAVVRTCIGLAECRLAEGLAEAAVELLQRACQADPTSLDAHVALGRSLLEVGRYDDGIQALQTALELRPGYDETHYLLAQAYSLNGQRELAQQHSQFVSTARSALDELDKINAALLQNSNDPDKLNRAGEILLQYGDPAEGIVRILTALDLAPDNLRSLQLLTDYYETKAASDPDYQQLADQYRSQLENLAPSAD